jgi:hypothetical protein
VAVSLETQVFVAIGSTLHAMIPIQQSEVFRCAVYHSTMEISYELDESL